MNDFQLESIIYQIGLPQLKRCGKHFHFRCILCGDSAKSKYKKRGWILLKDNTYFYYCHNCGHSQQLINFLKQHFHHLYLDYFKNVLFKKEVSEVKQVITEKIELEELDIVKISDLSSEHFARQYLINRNIPFKYFDNLYYTANYAALIKEKIGKEINAADNRIVIPIYNTKKKIVGVQGRALKKRGIRYVTILFNENELNVCGLERVNASKTIYVTEGYFDSLFLPNAISMNSASVNLDELAKIAPRNNFIFVFDNEKRNREINNRVIKIIKAGFKVCVWNERTYPMGKDINKMIENGYTREQIKTTIDDNIYSGLVAEIRVKLR